MSEQQPPATSAEPGPGMHVQPGPVTFQAGTRQVIAPGQPTTTVVYLRLEHTTGQTVVFLPAESAETLAQFLLDAASVARGAPRLAVPTGVIIPGINGHPPRGG